MSLYRDGRAQTAKPAPWAGPPARVPGGGLSLDRGVVRRLGLRVALARSRRPLAGRSIGGARRPGGVRRRRLGYALVGRRLHGRSQPFQTAGNVPQRSRLSTM